MQKSTIFLFLLILLMQSALAQDHKAILDEAAGKLVRERMEAQNQDILVHTDKSYYPAGSTIWFRVYLFQPLTGKPVSSSKIYADIIDQYDSIVSRTILNSAGNELDGGIRVSTRWKEGPYQLKIYTQEMISQPAVGKPYQAPLYIFQDDQRTAEVKTLQKIPAPGISVAVEGGNLVNGVNNLVAIRSFDDQGLPITISGYLKDERNNVVETFKSMSPGYSRFIFSPSKNRSYQVVVVMPDKTEKTFPLAPADPLGWQLSLSKSTGSSLTFRVGQGDSLYAQKPASYLLGVSKSMLGFASIGNGLYEVNVPLDKFPDGLATFYLLNSDRQVVSQRQVWIRKNNPRFSVTPNKTSYGPRETVNLDLDLKDPAGAPLSAVFSISVTDNRWIRPSSSFGFPGVDPELADIHLLTRPFSVSPVKEKVITDSGIVIAGQAFLKNDIPAANHIINLIATQENIILTDTTDGSGKFQFAAFGFYDNKPFMAQVTDMKGKRQEASVVNALPVPLIATEKTILADDTSAALFKVYQKSMADSFLTGRTKGMLEEIVVKGKSPKKESQAGSDRNKFTHMITAEQLDKWGLNNTVNAVLMLPGVILMNGRLTIRGGMNTADARGRTSSNEPLIITDGVPVPTNDAISYLNSIPPGNIEYIEVMTGSDAAQYGSRGANGVILIKTANTIRNPVKGVTQEMLYIYPLGYHQREDFYIPRYDVPEVREASFTDNRSTIYWNGEVLMDKNGRAKVSFYAADAPTSYTIRVTGISARGDLLDKIIRIDRK